MGQRHPAGSRCHIVVGRTPDVVDLLGRRQYRGYDTVEVRAEPASGQMVRLKVTDTGAGIPDDEQGELFKPFSRLCAGDSGVAGTGIGLVVCKNLIELMQGEIGVESEPGRGSTFWFELPGASRHQAGDDKSSRDVAAPETVIPGAAGRTLLYVEDNPGNLALMGKIIATVEGLSMISAQTGEQGIELAKAEAPDIIFLDINLPGINGDEVLHHLRQMDAFRDTPIFALSAAATRDDIENGMAAGFQRYLTKPFEISEIKQAIRLALQD